MDADEVYMDEALQEAEKAYAMGEVPIGAVLVDEAGNIIARAHNLREAGHDATAHAEMLVIREGCRKLHRWRLSGCTLFVTVEPCPMCAGAIVMSRVDRVVYGALDAKAGACESVFNIPGNPVLNHAPEMRAGVREQACADLMKRFFRERREKHKAEKKRLAASEQKNS